MEWNEGRAMWRNGASYWFWIWSWPKFERKERSKERIIHLFSHCSSCVLVLCSLSRVCVTTRVHLPGGLLRKPPLKCAGACLRAVRRTVRCAGLRPVGLRIVRRTHTAAHTCKPKGRRACHGHYAAARRRACCRARVSLICAHVRKAFWARVKAFAVLAFACEAAESFNLVLLHLFVIQSLRKLT